MSVNLNLYMMNTSLILRNCSRLNQTDHRRLFIKCLTTRLSGSHRFYCSVETDPGESRKIAVTSIKPARIMYMDTLKTSSHLQDRGLSREQAEAITEVLTEVVDVVTDHHTKVMVTKPQQEIMVQQLMAQIASVKKDMVILEKSEFNMIRNDTEKQGASIRQLEVKMNDEIKKLSGQIKLDLNLEKSRAIEAHALNEKNLQSTTNKLQVEEAKNDKNLKALEDKIQIELSNLRTQNEKYRNDFLKFFIGSVGTAAGLYMAYLRLMM